MPGIAGIVLTLAVAVDANVLINERIKEELSNGRTVQQAIDEGYRGAFSSIFDANVTTLIKVIILYAVGTGAIKGFAITTGIGIATSMFTAIVGTRAIVNLLYGGKRVKSCLSEECVVAQEYTVEQLNHGRKVWDFMRWDYWAFGISGFLLIVSIAIIGVRGFNWGLDFTGGTVIEVPLRNRSIWTRCAIPCRKRALKSRRCRTLAAAATSWYVCRRCMTPTAAVSWAARS